jgi:hypothetical protein
MWDCQLSFVLPGGAYSSPRRESLAEASPRLARKAPRAMGGQDTRTLTHGWGCSSVKPTVYSAPVFFPYEHLSRHEIILPVLFTS